MTFDEILGIVTSNPSAIGARRLQSSWLNVKVIEGVARFLYTTEGPLNFEARPEAWRHSPEFFPNTWDRQGQWEIWEPSDNCPIVMADKSA